MTTDDVDDALVDLVSKMHEQFRQSELDIAHALADADGPLSVEELVEATGYTERTVEKRVDTLEERLKGEPFLERDDEGRPRLLPHLARALRRHEAAAAE